MQFCAVLYAFIGCTLKGPQSHVYIRKVCDGFFSVCFFIFEVRAHFSVFFLLKTLTYLIENKLCCKQVRKG